MFQSTPFAKLDEAKAEYEKIFKQKSGNDWSNPDFMPVPKKYKLVKIHYQTVDRKDYLIPFTEIPQDRIKKSKLPKDISAFMEVITNAKGY